VTLLPKEIGGCTILHQCGNGAYGTIFLGKDALGRLVAIKLFHGNRDYARELDSLRRYAALQGQSPYLMQISHFGCEEGRLFYVMEAADNALATTDAAPGCNYTPDTLAYRLRDGRRMECRDAIELCQRLLDALEPLHLAGFAHRDIKPDNLIFVKGTPRLSDPDLLCDNSRTMSLVGTLGYMPPEILQKPSLNKGPMADIFAVGKMLYVMATGLIPEAFPMMPPDLTQETLSTICRPLLRLCSDVPSRRPRTIEECRRLLAPHDASAKQSQGSSGSAILASLSRRIALLRLGKKLRYWVCTAAALLLLCAAGIMALCRHHRQAIAETTQRREWWQQRVVALSDQLARPIDNVDDAERQSLHGALKELVSRKDWAHAAFRKADSDLTARLAAAAKAGMPACDGSGLTQEAIYSNGQGYGYLASPLVRDFASEEVKNALLVKLSEEADRIYPAYSELRAGKDFREGHIDVPYQLNFVPPGCAMVSDVSHQPMRVDYPFWIMPELVSSGLYSSFVPAIPPETRPLPPADPIQPICQNDVVLFCHELTQRMKQRNMLPPGYAFRPPTLQELMLAEHSTWQGRPAVADEASRQDPFCEYLTGYPGDDVKYNPDPNCFLREYPHESMTGWDIRKGPIPMDNFLWYHTKRFIARNHADFKNNRDVGLRVVLAPTDEDFFQKNFLTRHDLNTAVSPTTGKCYAGAAVSIARLPGENLRAFAQSLGARLAEPEDAAEWQKIRLALDIPPLFPTFIGALHDSQSRKWRLASTGKEVQFLPTPVQEDVAEDSMLYATAYQLGVISGTRGLPGLILEWPSRQAMERAGEKWRNDATPCDVIRRIKTPNGHSYYLVHVTTPAYYAEALCKLGGLRMAMPADAETLQQLQEMLKEEKRPVLLGAHRLLEGGWAWNDGTPVVLPQAPQRLLTGPATPSPTYDGLCICDGVVAATTSATIILAEEL